MIRKFVAATMLAWMILSPWSTTVTTSAFVITTVLPSRNTAARSTTVGRRFARKGQPPATAPTNKMTSKRRNQLGIADDEDEYDLEKALENNTDPFISKLVAGSLIVVLLGLLIVGVIVPSLTDYGEGVCSPIQNAGRC